MTEIPLLSESGFGLHTLQSKGGTKIRLLPSGCIYDIQHGHIQINQILASPLAGGMHRIWLRVHEGEQITSIPVVGPEAESSVSVGDRAFIWEGSDARLKFRCVCTTDPDRNAWFFRVAATNITNRPIRCDVIQLQDLGLATRGHVRNNELFTSQYIDHFVADHPAAGCVLMSRQNLPQIEQTHPWLMQGCFPRAAGFVTDGADFFGPAHRAGAAPAALSREIIGNRIRQGEIAYIAIQSNASELQPSASFQWTFFAGFLPDRPQPSSADDLIRLDGISKSPADEGDVVELPADRSVFQTSAIFQSESLTTRDIEQIFPGAHRHAERIDGRPASFFFGDGRHVVLREKEISCARSHGHILRAGQGLMPDGEILSCVCWAGGVFASAPTVGNATLAKLFSGVRDPLNVVRSSGLRMFVRGGLSERWQQLATPSAFEMGLCDCRWHYRRGGERITVTARVSEDDPAITFDVETAHGPMELLISGEIAAGPAEYETSPQLLIDSPRKRLTVEPAAESILAQRQPRLRFHLVTSTPGALATLGNDGPLFLDGRPRRLPYLTMQTRPTSSFRFTILGTLDDDRAAPLLDKYESIEPSQDGFWNKITAGLRIRSTFQATDEIQDALTWFARDAVIHLSAPRGLDQPNGGAWGVRDVTQGAVEFLLSYGHSDVVADILRRLFSQQYDGRFDWPQWFMFPPFQRIQSPHCHGDVLIWPLKALCDYLEETNDLAFLREQLPYTSVENFQPTARREGILQHVDRLIQKLREQFIPGLSLPRYGEGDWDDSLQPADATLRDRMVSSWTVELIYQTLARYQTAMQRAGEDRRAEEAQTLAQSIRADFQRHLVPDGVVAGFAIFDGNPPRPVEYLLHPSDARTGLRYRLIPMTRGILSEIFSPQQAQEHLELIQKHLLFPDGARLMDRPTRYAGGRETTFRRSESAAFFGREIGLQYVHAHLRYAEALAKLGRGEALWRALHVVNPISVTQMVPSAEPRQRNCYFSSSDAAFPDRYAATRDYEKLRRGEIATAGGWRVYSSGPGIYTNLVVRHLLGLRRFYDWIEFDPVLPGELQTITCQRAEAGRRMVYEISASQAADPKVHVNGHPMAIARAENPYRKGAIQVRRADFERAIRSQENFAQIRV